MDQVTQQNSALVEENAATAKTLEHQAKAMDERVAFFRIAAGAEDAWPAVQRREPAAAARPAAPKVGAPKAGAPQPAASRARISDVVGPKSIATPSSAPKPLAANAARNSVAGRADGAAVAMASRGPVARMQAAIAEAMTDPEWKEF
jgi:hypothetical protein